MRTDSVVITAKGAAYAVIGVLTPWSVALAQWAKDGAWPSGLMCLAVTVASLIGAASAVLSFLSESYAKYLEAKKPRQAVADELDVRLQAVKAEAKRAKLQKVLNE